MLISEKTTRSIYLFIYLFIYFFFASKEAYPIVRQLEKNNGEKSGSESSKMRENQILVTPTPWSLKC